MKIIVAAAGMLMLLSSAIAHAQETAATFEADSTVRQITEAYSLDMVDFAKNQFNITLDWSDASVK